MRTEAEAYDDATPDYRHNPLVCPVCSRVIGASRHGVISRHKRDGRKCPGTGCYGNPVVRTTTTQED